MCEDGELLDLGEEMGPGGIVEGGYANLRNIERRVRVGCAGKVQAKLGERAEVVEERSGDSAKVRVRLTDLGKIVRP